MKQTLRNRTLAMCGTKRKKYTTVISDKRMRGEDKSDIQLAFHGIYSNSCTQLERLKKFEGRRFTAEGGSKLVRPNQFLSDKRNQTTREKEDEEREIANYGRDLRRYDVGGKIN